MPVSLRSLIKSDKTKNIIIAIFVVSLFLVPRLLKSQKMENDATELEKIQIVIPQNTAEDVEMFGRNVLIALEDNVPDKYKAEFYEAFAFISYARRREENTFSKYDTVSDLYTSGLLVLYNAAKDNGNKITLLDIIKISEGLKVQRKQFWKDFIDSQDAKTK